MTPGWNMPIATHKNFILEVHTLWSSGISWDQDSVVPILIPQYPGAHIKKWGSYKEHIQGVQNKILCNRTDAAELVPGRLKGLTAHRIQSSCTSGPFLDTGNQIVSTSKLVGEFPGLLVQRIRKTSMLKALANQISLPRPLTRFWVPFQQKSFPSQGAEELCS